MSHLSLVSEMRSGCHTLSWVTLSVVGGRRSHEGSLPLNVLKMRQIYLALSSSTTCCIYLDVQHTHIRHFKGWCIPLSPMSSPQRVPWYSAQPSHLDRFIHEVRTPRTTTGQCHSFSLWSTLPWGWELDSPADALLVWGFEAISRTMKNRPWLDGLLGPQLLFPSLSPSCAVFGITLHCTVFVL